MAAKLFDRGLSRALAREDQQGINGLRCCPGGGGGGPGAGQSFPDLSGYVFDTEWEDVGGELDTILDTHSTRSISSFAFSPDGLTFLVGNFFDDIIQTWNLGTAWDPSSATTQAGSDCSINSPKYVRFEDGGSKVSCWDSGDDYNTIDLATNYVITAGDTITTSADDTEFGSNDSGDGPVCFSTDGAYLVAAVEITNQDSLAITSVTTPYDLDGGLGTPDTYDWEANLSVLHTAVNSRIFIDPAGTGILFSQDATSGIARFTLGTAYDPSTVTKDSNILSYNGGVSINEFWISDDFEYIFTCRRTSTVLVQRYVKV